MVTQHTSIELMIVNLLTKCMSPKNFKNHGLGSVTIIQKYDSFSQSIFIYVA